MKTWWIKRGSEWLQRSRSCLEYFRWVSVSTHSQCSLMYQCVSCFLFSAFKLYFIYVYCVPACCLQCFLMFLDSAGPGPIWFRCDLPIWAAGPRLHHRSCHPRHRVPAQIHIWHRSSETQWTLRLDICKNKDLVNSIYFLLYSLT